MRIYIHQSYADIEDPKIKTKNHQNFHIHIHMYICLAGLYDDGTGERTSELLNAINILSLKACYANMA